MQLVTAINTKASRAELQDYLASLYIYWVTWLRDIEINYSSSTNLFYM
jgi:hypothetical protein